jgi:hypothetical protein
VILLTEKQIAEHIGCHPDTVHALEKKGLPVIRITPRIKRYDLDMVRKWIASKESKKTNPVATVSAPPCQSVEPQNFFLITYSMEGKRPVSAVICDESPAEWLAIWIADADVANKVAILYSIQITEDQAWTLANDIENWGMDREDYGSLCGNPHNEPKKKI